MLLKQNERSIKIRDRLNTTPGYMGQWYLG